MRFAAVFSLSLAVLLACLMAVTSAYPSPAGGQGQVVPPHQRGLPELSPREVEDLVVRKTKYPNCSPAGTHPGDNGILLPKKTDNITVNKPFELYYCSPTYHETRSVSYDVFAINSGFPDTGLLLASDVKQQIINVTVPDAWYNQIGVFERQTSFGGSGYQFVMKKKTIKISDESEGTH